MSDPEGESSTAAGPGGHSGYYDRIRTVAREASEARAAFDPPVEEPEERALAYARDGVGSVVGLYVEARTAEWDVEFSGEELDLLHGALNDYLELYTRCYGVELEADFTVREAAEILLQTHDIRQTAELLTTVPDRH